MLNNEFQQIYNRQIANIVFMQPTNDKEVQLKSSFRSVTPYLSSCIAVVVVNLLIYLILQNIFFIYLMFISVIFFIYVFIDSVAKMRTINISDEGISVKYMFTAKRNYEYSQVKKFVAFPVALQNSFNANYVGLPKNLLEITFDDNRKLALPILSISFAHTYKFLSSNIQNYPNEFAKIRDFYLKFSIDLDSGEQSGEQKGCVEGSPFEGF